MIPPPDEVGEAPLIAVKDGAAAASEESAPDERSSVAGALGESLSEASEEDASGDDRSPDSVPRGSSTASPPEAEPSDAGVSVGLATEAVGNDSTPSSVVRGNSLGWTPRTLCAMWRKTESLPMASHGMRIVRGLRAARRRWSKGHVQFAGLAAPTKDTAN